MEGRLARASRGGAAPKAGRGRDSDSWAWQRGWVPSFGLRTPSHTSAASAPGIAALRHLLCASPLRRGLWAPGKELPLPPQRTSLISTSQFTLMGSFPGLPWPMDLKD